MSAFAEPLAQARRALLVYHRADFYSPARAALDLIEQRATELAETAAGFQGLYEASVIDQARLEAAEQRAAAMEAHLRAALNAFDAIDQGTRDDAKMGYPLPGESCTYVALALHADETFAAIRAFLLTDMDEPCSCCNGEGCRYCDARAALPAREEAQT